MSTSLTEQLQVTSLIAVTDPAAQQCVVLPRLGFENSRFRLLYGREIQQLRLHSLDDIPLDEDWHLANAARALELPIGALTPGEHQLQLEWQSQRGRHEQTLHFEVRPGYVVNPGPIVDVTADAEQVFIARSSEVALWTREGQRRGTLLLPGMHAISALGTAATSALLAVGCDDGQLFLLNKHTGEAVHHVRMNTHPVTNVVITDGGSLLFALSGLRQYRVYQLKGNSLTLVNSGESQDDIHTIEYSPTAAGMQSLRLIKLSLPETSGRLIGTQFDDGQTLILTSEKGVLIDQQQVLQTLALPSEWSSAGRWVRARLIEESATSHQLLALSTKGLYSLVVDRQEKTLAMQLLWAHDVIRDTFRTFITGTGNVISSEQKLLVVRDGKLKVNQTELSMRSLTTEATDETSWTAVDPDDSVADLSASTVLDHEPLADLLAVGDDQGRVALFDLTQKHGMVYALHGDNATQTYHANTKNQEGRASEVSALRFIPERNLLFSTGVDCQWSLHRVSGCRLQTLWTRPIDGNGQGLALLPQANLVALTTPLALSLWTWDQQRATLIDTWRSHGDILEPVAVSPDGTTLAVGDWAGYLHLFAVDAAGLKERGGFSVSTESLLALVFLNHHQLIAFTEERVMVLLDIAEHRVIATAPSHHLIASNRRQVPLRVTLPHGDYLGVGPFHTASPLTNPLYLLPPQQLCWNAGRLFFDPRDLLLDTDALGRA